MPQLTNKPVDTMSTTQTDIDKKALLLQREKEQKDEEAAVAQRLAEEWAQQEKDREARRLTRKTNIEQNNNPIDPP